MARENNNATYQVDQSKLNQEQYDILKRCSRKQNISEWNSYRAGQPGVRINLQNADLRGARLEGAKLTGANLAGARFEGADLLAADLRNADLTGANLEKANLWGAALSEANLEQACLVSANLENADLRDANLEKANLWGTNLEGTIVEAAAVETAIEDSQPGLKEKIEVVVNLADDITYEEFAGLLKCLEGLSLAVGGSLPHLNEVQICQVIGQQIKERAAWQETGMSNSISVDIPKNVAENLHEVFLWRVAAGQAINGPAEAQAATCMQNSEGCNQLREFLASAGFSENERNNDFANRMLPDMERDGTIENLWAVANLFECGRIQFRHRSN